MLLMYVLSLFVSVIHKGFKMLYFIFSISLFIFAFLVTTLVTYIERSYIIRRGVPKTVLKELDKVHYDLVQLYRMQGLPCPTRIPTVITSLKAYKTHSKGDLQYVTTEVKNFVKNYRDDFSSNRFSLENKLYVLSSRINQNKTSKLIQRLFRS